MCGEPPESEPDFSFSAGDRLETVATPAGKVDVLSLCDRADFEHCIRALAHRCENGDVPSTMGVSIISGLINWEKIRKHKEEYVAGGGDDWSGEFERFTSDRKNYRDTIIVLSQGYYSALLPAEAGFPGKEWLELSYTIRKYHELAHFVSQRLYPENKDALRAIRLCTANGFRVMVQTNVHQINLHTMLSTAKLMDELGVEVMRIIRTSESPRWIQNANV